MNLDLGRPMRADELYRAVEATATAIQKSDETAWAPAFFANEPDATGWHSGNRLVLGLDSCQPHGSLRISPLGSSVAFTTEASYRRVRVFSVQGTTATCSCHEPVRLTPEEATEIFVKFFRKALDQH